MKNNVEKQIFKKGSTTYFWSSLFFPKKVRQDVFRLYSFVRVVDDYVDKKFPDTKNFEQVVALYEGKKPAKASQKNRRVASNMHLVEKKYELDKSWGVAFIKSMRMDIKQKRYKNIDDSLDYVYGSAEVIGLMMSKILGIDISSAITKKSATMQGRAMQWINFIRDIDEDNALGRQYFPQDALAEFGLENLSKKECQSKPDNFADFVRSEIERYQNWQKQADESYRQIPRRFRVPLKTASDMYNWTAQQIYKNPKIVFERKVKPSKWRVIITALRNFIIA